MTSKLWDLFSNGNWIGMAEGDSPQEAIQMAKRCLPERVARNEQMRVIEYVRNPPTRVTTAKYRAIKVAAEGVLT